MAKNLMSIGFRRNRWPGQPGQRFGQEAGVTLVPAVPAGAAHRRTGWPRRPALRRGSPARRFPSRSELAADEDPCCDERAESKAPSPTARVRAVGIGGVVIGDIRARAVSVKEEARSTGTSKPPRSIAAMRQKAASNALGDLTAPRVGIVEGARFVGSVKMTRISVTTASARALPVE